MIAVAVLGATALLAGVAGRWSRWPVWLVAALSGSVPAGLMALLVIAMGGQQPDVIASAAPVLVVGIAICIAAAAIGRWRKARVDGA